MTTRDSRIDAYIAKAAPFAQPILRHVREVVHEACPEVEETLKWGMPSFVYAGRLLCGMAAFKQHASFGFWKHALVVGEPPQTGMGGFGKLASIKDLPPKRTLVAYIRKAMALNEQGVKATAARKATTRRSSLPMAPDLAAALELKRNAAAKRTFDAFSPSQRREYVEWIMEAKRTETRARRLAQTIEQLADGKTLHWKYASR